MNLRSFVFKTPDGTSLAGTDLVIQKIEQEVWKLRGVKHVLSTINGGGSSGVTDGSVYVGLKDITERKFTQFDVMEDARRMMKDKFPGLRSGADGVRSRWHGMEGSTSRSY